MTAAARPGAHRPGSPHSRHESDSITRRNGAPLEGRDRAPYRLAPVLTAWGIQAIVAQSLLLREAQVLMSGSELVWGIVLFAWLSGVGMGAAAAGWAATRLRSADAALTAILLALGLATCLDLWAMRGARAWLGVGPGELVPLVKITAAALALVTPVGALVGAAFPVACVAVAGSRNSIQARPTGALGPVYALEAFGSLVGGAAFSFWAVEHLAPIQTALACLALTALACLVLLGGRRGRGGVRAALLAIALVAIGVALFAGRDLDRRLIALRWRNTAPGYELCAEVESKHQNLALGRRAGQFTLYCDGQVSADFPDPYTDAPLAHLWMCQHPDPRAVLVLGGGAEGLLAGIARHPVDRVDYVDLDSRKLELIRPFLTDADRRALDDERIHVRHVDARHFVKTRRNRFDLVIARLPEPTSAQRGRFYTEEFFGELRRSMTERSVLCTTVSAAPADLPAATARYLASIRAGLLRHFPVVVVGAGDPAHVFAATEPGLISIDGAELARRYAERGVQSPYFHPAMFDGASDGLDPVVIRDRAARLQGVEGVEVARDLRPVTVLDYLALWEAMTDGASAGVIDRIRSIKARHHAIMLGGMAGLTLIGFRLRGGRGAGWQTGATMLSIAATGFVTMALTIIWLFSFQNLYGYVYQRIGWIVGLFMAGLVIGCLVADRRRDHRLDAAGLVKSLWHRLIVVDVLIAGLACLVPLIIPALGRFQETGSAIATVEWTLSLLVAATGVLGGVAFATAGGVQFARTQRTGPAAGHVVGADHIGAALGALLTGVVMVPALGITVTAFLLAGVKLASAAILVITRHETSRAPFLAT